MDLVKWKNRTWIHWKGTWIWWPEYGSIERGHGSGEQNIDLVVPFEMEHGSQILKKGWCVCHLFGWAGRHPFLPTCSMWKFIFELAHVLIWGLIPSVSHCKLCCIWGSNPDAGHFVMAWSLACITCPHKGSIRWHLKQKTYIKQKNLSAKVMSLVLWGSR